MYSFYDKNIIITQLFRIHLIFSSPCFEIKNRKKDFLSIKQPAHILIKFFYINCFNTFKIIISFFISRRMFPVYKIIVHSNRMGPEAIDPELDSKSVGKGRFSGRRRSCHQYKLYISPFCDLLGNLPDSPLLISFLNKHNFPHIIPGHHFIQRSYRINLLSVSPADRFFQHVK